MAYFKATLANHFFWVEVGVNAPDIKTARHAFEAYSQSDYMLSAASEERSMWLEEHGKYPGDSAYVYALVAKSVEEIDSDDRPNGGHVIIRKSGPNG